MRPSLRQSEIEKSTQVLPNFINPTLLWFLPLIAVPVILHLITLHRLRTVELSTFRFLMDSYVQQRRRLKLIEYLLLLLRTAFVLLIILAMARPQLQRFGWLFGAGTGRDVAIIVDASPTMAMRNGTTTRLERARAAARHLMPMLGKEDHVTLIEAGATPLVRYRGFAANTTRIAEQIDQIETASVSGDVGACLRAAFGGKSHGPRLAYVLTGGHAGAWRGLDEQTDALVLDQGARVVVLNVGSDRQVSNLSVVGDPPRLDRPVVGLPVELTATVQNTSGEQTVDTVLSVTLDDNYQVAQMEVSVPPGRRVTRAVHLTPSRAGVIRGRFELRSDAFPDDDVYLFCLNVQHSVRVVVVAPPDGELPADRPNLYLRAALRSPIGIRTARTKLLSRVAAALTVEHVTPDALSSDALSNIDVMILADTTLDATRGKIVRDFVTAGGGLLVLPGARVNPDDYRAFLWPNGFSATDDRLPAGLLQPPVGQLDDEAAFMPVTWVDMSHDVFKVFADAKHQFFGTTKLYRYFPLRLPDRSSSNTPHRFGVGDAGPAANQPWRALMRLSDRTPVLVEGRIGRGRMLVAGFPPTPDWSNLPVKPEFVPWLLQSVMSLRGPSTVTTPASVSPQKPARIKLDPRWSVAHVEVTDADDRPHTIAMHRAPDSMVGAMLQTSSKGYYEFTVLPRTQGAPEHIARGFAVNLDVSTEDFAPIDAAHVDALLAPASVFHVTGTPDDPLLVHQLTRRREVWRTLIWVMFIVIGIEFFLATLRPGPAPAGGQDAGTTSAGFPDRLRRAAGRMTSALTQSVTLRN